MLTILFDGVAYGMLLFVLACGLSVTLGLMNFVNLAHGAFAMAGGYITVVLVNRAGVPFLAGLVLAFFATAIIGVILERTLYVHVYAKSHLDQVLFTIGLVLMAMPIADFFLGNEARQVNLPAWLSGSLSVHGVGISRYRLFIVAVCGVIAAALQLFLVRTRFGAQLRAAVDDARVANGLGVSILSQVPVATLIWQRMGPSLALGIATIVVSVLVAVPLGILAARRPGSPLDRALMAFSVLGFSGIAARANHSRRGTVTVRAQSL